MVLKTPSKTSKDSQEDLQPKKHKTVLSSADIEARKAYFKQFQAARAWLKLSFPKAFNFKKPQSFKLGIKHDLLRIPSLFSKRRLCDCLGIYANSRKYLEAPIQENWRYDLSGEQVEQVMQSQKNYVLKRLEYKNTLWEKKYKKKHN